LRRFADVRNATIVVYSERGREWCTSHEAAALGHVARVIARQTGWTWGGYCLSSVPTQAPSFLIPDETLLASRARGLGIERVSDFLGGIVQTVVARTKAIVHPLIGSSAARPEDWPAAFPAAVKDVVLPGFTAFSAADAAEAVRRLLPLGAVRAKRTLGTGGRHQRVITRVEDVPAALDAIDEDELTRFGLVLETNLEEVATASVGQLTIDDVTLSYHGMQRETTDNGRRTVYGGSDLFCVRGDWGVLAAAVRSPLGRRAIAQARAYDREAHAHVGLLASRRNYDIGRGVDGHGRWRAGVFEHSWRVGGATPAEVAAFEIFRENPGQDIVHASTVERYGRDVRVPRGAVVHYQGDDPYVGPITCYTLAGDAAREAA
jgi:hypothetical protein